MVAFQNFFHNPSFYYIYLLLLFQILEHTNHTKQIKFQTDVSNLSAQSLVHCSSFFLISEQSIEDRQGLKDMDLGNNLKAELIAENINGRCSTF